MFHHERQVILAAEARIFEEKSERIFNDFKEKIKLNSKEYMNGLNEFDQIKCCVLVPELIKLITAPSNPLKMVVLEVHYLINDPICEYILNICNDEFKEFAVIRHPSLIKHIPNRTSKMELASFLYRGSASSATKTEWLFFNFLEDIEKYFNKEFDRRNGLFGLAEVNSLQELKELERQKHADTELAKNMAMFAEWLEKQTYTPDKKLVMLIEELEKQKHEE